MFKAIRIYECHPGFTAPEELNDLLLLSYPFNPCSRSELSSAGFMPSSDGLIICRTERKIIPASEINRRVDDIVAESGRPVGRKERDAIREDVVQQLLPQAFSKFNTVYGYFHNGYLVVGASSASAAEDFNAGIRATLGSLPIKPWNIGYDCESLFTSWLAAREAPDPLELGDTAELAGADKSVVKVKNIELESEQIAQHLSAGMFCTELRLGIPDVAWFTVRSDWSIKALVPSDVVEFDEFVDGTAAEQRIADYYIFREIINTVKGALDEHTRKL